MLITSELVYVYADPVAKKSQAIPAPLRDMLEGFERGEVGGDLAAVLVDVLDRLDQRFEEPMPYMLWIHQRPTDGGAWPGARVCVTIAPLLRAPGTQRYVAAAELGGGVYFNPVDPALAAAALRALPGAPG